MSDKLYYANEKTGRVDTYEILREMPKTLEIRRMLEDVPGVSNWPERSLKVSKEGLAKGSVTMGISANYKILYADREVTEAVLRTKAGRAVREAARELHRAERILRRVHEMEQLPCTYCNDTGREDEAVRGAVIKKRCGVCTDQYGRRI